MPIKYLLNRALQERETCHFDDEFTQLAVIHNYRSTDSVTNALHFCVGIVLPNRSQLCSPLQRSRSIWFTQREWEKKRSTITIHSITDAMKFLSNWYQFKLINYHRPALPAASVTISSLLRLLPRQIRHILTNSAPTITVMVHTRCTQQMMIYTATQSRENCFQPNSFLIYCTLNDKSCHKCILRPSQVGLRICLQFRFDCRLLRRQ